MIMSNSDTEIDFLRRENLYLRMRVEQLERERSMQKPYTEPYSNHPGWFDTGKNPYRPWYYDPPIGGHVTIC